MKKSVNQILLIVIGIISIVTLVKIFTNNAQFKLAKEQLNKIEQALNDAKNSNKQAQNEINELKKSLIQFEDKLSLIEAERDSLVLAQQRKTAKNWDELQQIKTKQKLNNQKLNILREEGVKFE